MVARPRYALALVVVAILALTGLLIALSYNYFHRDELIIAVRPSKGLAEKVYVHVLALYPSGLRDIGKFVFDFEKEGVGEVTLELSDLKKAWLEESRVNKRFAEPYLVIAGYTRSGKVVVKSISTLWSKLPERVEVELAPLENINVSRGKIKPGQAEYQGQVEYQGLEPLNGCWETRYLVDSYEAVREAIITKISPDAETWGAISVFWLANRKIGVRVSVFVESEWTSLGYIGLSKNEYGSFKGAFSKGETYYVWMDVKYRYERWHVHSNCDGVIMDYDEEYIYIVDYYPSTLSGGTSPPPDSSMPPVDSWDCKGRYTSAARDSPYYILSQTTYGSSYIAVDALKFIELLQVLGKISSEAALAASVIGLFISVNFAYENIVAVDFGVWLYSEAGYSHDVYIGKSTDVETIPMLYAITVLQKKEGSII